MNEFGYGPWECCGEHETTYLQGGYCKDCKIEQLETENQLAWNTCDEAETKANKLQAQVEKADRVIMQNRTDAINSVNRIEELQAKLEASERKRIGVEAQCDELLDDCDRLIAEIKELQSQVDALMQEYCPADITVEQWQRIEAAAITASSTESAAIQQALQEKGDEKSNSTT